MDMLINTKSRIRKLRNHLGLTQKEFASLIGVSTQSVKNWETGINGIKIYHLAKIAELAKDIPDHDVPTVEPKKDCWQCIREWGECPNEDCDPTIDVPDEKVGKWIDDKDPFYPYSCHCSVCGGDALTEAGTPYEYVQSAFCPHCGADMRTSDKTSDKVRGTEE